MIHNGIHVFSVGCPRPSIALQVQNRGLKHQLCPIFQGDNDDELREAQRQQQHENAYNFQWSSQQQTTAAARQGAAGVSTPDLGYVHGGEKEENDDDEGFDEE